ncbi:MAG: hypothetical protein QOF76_5067 [Solirubrobacteraceae bacterium]|jgi:hypothetical protein|nr:hypothetical protein [Solirubrobacteraceae bacterium]
MSVRLELALHAYPQDVRAKERDVLLGLAHDMIDGGASVTREATALGLDGLRLRFARRRVGSAPWRDGLRLAGLPIAVLLLTLTVTGCLGMMHAPGWIGWWWTAGIGGSLLALVGLAAGWRRPATLGSLLLFGLCVLDLRNGSREVVSVYTMHRTGPHAFDFGTTGTIDFTALGVSSLGPLVLLAASLTISDRRPQAVRNITWSLLVATAVTVAAAYAGTGLWPFTSPFDTPAQGLNAAPGAVVLGIAILTAAAGLLVRRDAPGRLAATLGAATLAPAIVLAAQACLPAREGIVLGPLYLLALATAVCATGRALIHSTA